MDALRYPVHSELYNLVPDTSRTHAGFLGYRQTRTRSPYFPMIMPPVARRLTHTMVVGGTDAGKTSRFMIPNIMHDLLNGIGVIMVDTKIPEIREGLGLVVPFAKRLNRPVSLLLPYHEYSQTLNLIDRDLSSEEAGEIAYLIFPKEEKENAGIFYRNAQRRILKNLIIANSRDAARGFETIREKIRAGRDGIEGYILRFDRGKGDLVDEMHNFLTTKNESRVGDFLEGLLVALEMFDNGNLAENTSNLKPELSIDFESLLSGGLIYIGIPQVAINNSNGSLVLQLIKRRIDQYLHGMATKYGGRIPNIVTVYYDEFSNLGVLPNIENDFATMRSRGVNYIVGLQNTAGGRNLYGRDGLLTIMEGNIGTLVTFPASLGPEDQEYFSRAAGEITAREESKSVSKESFTFLKVRRTKAEKYVSRDLLAQPEMRTCPSDVGVIFTRQLHPLKTLMPGYFEPKVRNKRNLFGEIYRDLPSTFDVLASAVVHTHQIVRARQSDVKETLQRVVPKARTVAAPEGPPSADEGRDVDPTPRVEGQESRGVVNNLLKSLLFAKVEIDLDEPGGRLAKVEIPWLTVSDEVTENNAERLGILEKRGLGHFVSSSFVLTERGRELVIGSVLSMIREANTKKERLDGEPSEDAVMNVINWLHETTEPVVILPTNESIPSTTKAAVYPGEVKVAAGLFAEMYPNKTLATRRGKIGGARVELVVISLDDLPGYPKLLKFVAQNARVIYGHPERDETLEDLKTILYRPKVVRLAPDVAARLGVPGKPARYTGWLNVQLTLG